ncbi:hypothetical protein [Fulvivirga sp.]|uniref:hypothetical protein n=1 Tax=Fulvivirga sp. TaxID=1931237 RepID=UPI0032EDCB42
MANRVRWFHVINWKNITGILFILLMFLGAAIFFKLPQITRNYELSRLNGETKGYLTSVEPNTMMKQGHEGNKLVIESYDVSYKYIVNDQAFSGKEKIKNTGKNEYYLKQVVKSELKISVIIKYDTQNPKISLLKLEP